MPNIVRVQVSQNSQKFVFSNLWFLKEKAEINNKIAEIL